MASNARHITLPKGFKAAGVKCGIKVSDNEDLAIFVADSDASAAIVTTSNQIVGAPINWCRSILPRQCGKIRAMVINSGNSNVCTGTSGLKDAEAMATQTAKCLDTEPSKVLVASTGIIGHKLPMAKIRRGIADAAGSLSLRNDSAALRAIMTTDTREKSAVVMTSIGRKPVTISGIVKGAGMIAPSMATMISVITTDAAISPAVLKKALKEVVRVTFNAITIDSDQSTSDIAVVLASGIAANKTITAGTADYRKFVKTLQEVCDALARSMVADGEGATKTISITVKGARSDRDAEAAAKSVANSPLFKCAIHGCDPNWGRIAMALGKSSAKVTGESLSIMIGDAAVFKNGQGTKFSAKAVSKYLQGSEIEVICDLKLGKSRFTAITCDLSKEYVTINADYHT